MSWASTGSSDFVTNNNVLDAIANGIFSLKPGQSVTANNTWITKAEANAKLNIDNIGGTVTDWPVKSQFNNSLVLYNIIMTSQWAGAYSSSTTLMCAADLDQSGILQTTNSNGIVGMGDIVYSSGAPYTGADVISYYAGDSVRRSYHLSAGTIVEVLDCGTGRPTINITSSFVLGSNVITVEATGIVTTDIIVNVQWQDSVGNTDATLITIPVGNYTNSRSVISAVYFTSVIGISPTSDATNDYTYS